jgi:uncharacterized membrane protein YkvA (DUF1232 family)
MSKFKVTFTLDDADANYFRNLYRKAKKGAAGQDPQAIVKEAMGLVERVRGSKKTPGFVVEAIDVLADLAELVEDKDYAPPKSVHDEVLAALAYFSNPEDLIPDHIPALGFLDDAIMVKFIEEELKHEIWGYRKFRKFRQGAEQRPWTSVARQRLPKRLEQERKKIRSDISKRNAKDAARKKAS